MQNVVALVPRPQLSQPLARTLTDSIKVDVENLGARLLSAYERGVHTALGYASWGAYMTAEFGTNYARAYQLLNATRVTQAIAHTSREAESTMVDSLPERVARELVPVLRKGEEAVTEAWAEVVKEHGPTPTAEQTRATVRRQTRAAPSSRKRNKPSREQVEFGRNLSAMAICGQYASTVLAVPTAVEREQVEALLDVDEDTWREWQQHIRVIDNAARQLRRRINVNKDGGS